MAKYESFVIFADMRTGSNYLEARMAARLAVVCDGELFNPAFIGHKDQAEFLGWDMPRRDADPEGFLARCRKGREGLPGFRYFPGHDPRILSAILSDRSCAKIVLSRNPLDSYVSLKIARQTGRWQLKGGEVPEDARIHFDAAEFETLLADRARFHGEITGALQRSGQTAFHIRYDDLPDDKVIRGIGRFLGAGERDAPSRTRLRPQNPQASSAKIANLDDARRGLAELDPFDLFALPEFEPSRGPNVPTWLTQDDPPLLYLPIPGGPTDRVMAWMAAGGAAPAAGGTQKTIRKWKRQHPGHRSFTVVTHPLERAWRGFREHVLFDGESAFREIRGTLSSRYGAALPGEGDGMPSPNELRALFTAFLRFVGDNIAGRTPNRVPAVWASQDRILAGFSDVARPDFVFHVRDLTDRAGAVHQMLGMPAAEFMTKDDVGPLADIYDDDIETACRRAYPRDFMSFGFQDWSRERLS